MPSLWYEGFGLIVMESHAARHPGGVERFRADCVEAKRGTGYVIPVKHHRALRAGLRRARHAAARGARERRLAWVDALRELLGDRAAYERESLPRARPRSASSRARRGRHGTLPGAPGRAPPPRRPRHHRIALPRSGPCCSSACASGNVGMMLMSSLGLRHLRSRSARRHRLLGAPMTPEDADATGRRGIASAGPPSRRVHTCLRGSTGDPMRILLAQNSLYYPAHGGGDKSNRLLMEALAARGHECRVVARISVFGEAEHARYLRSARRARRRRRAPPTTAWCVFDRAGVDVARRHQRQPARRLRRASSRTFAPTSSWPPPTTPRSCCSRPPCAPRARVVYLARATLAVPFGPDCAFPSEAKTARIRACDAVVGVSQYVADYIRTLRRHRRRARPHLPDGARGVARPRPLRKRVRHLRESLRGEGHRDLPRARRRASRRPRFAAVPTWGTNAARPRGAGARPNVRLLAPGRRYRPACWRARACCWCPRCGPRRARASCSKPCCAACR